MHFERRIRFWLDGTKLQSHWYPSVKFNLDLPHIFNGENTVETRGGVILLVQPPIKGTFFKTPLWCLFWYQCIAFNQCIIIVKPVSSKWSWDYFTIFPETEDRGKYSPVFRVSRSLSSFHYCPNKRAVNIIQNVYCSWGKWLKISPLGHWRPWA